ncbi:MAG: tetratricopeptide repeat protein [Chlorobi bacterium]|nr:tetratricopeptide repeat protein [Chlorobiota bacterium]
MLKKISTVFILFVLVVLSVNAQQINDKKLVKDYNEAVKLANNNDFEDAITIFKSILEKAPEDIDVLYNLGNCYLNTSNGPDSAVIMFEKASRLLPEEDYMSELGVDLQLSLGKSYQMLMRYDDAIDLYKNFLKMLSEDDVELEKEVRRELEICYNAKDMISHPVALKVKNLGPKINSKYDDHSPIVSADESILIFTSRRASSYSERMPDGQYEERIYISTLDENGNYKKARILRKDLFKRPGHTAGVSLSADGTELLIYRNDVNGSNIYEVKFDGTNWTEPVKMPAPINSKYDETHASLSYDNNIIFFTSNRPGGFGGLDIYQVRRLPDGSWGLPKNLGPAINTPYDEETPVLHPDGKTLFFASEGHNTMGNFDIFYSHINADSTWSEPVNIGYPINTPDDDFFFTPTTTRNKAYYASSKYEDNYGRSDIYEIEYQEPVDNRLAVIKGVVHTMNDAPLENVRIYVTEKPDGTQVGIYRPNPGTGKYVLILEADKDYNIRFTGLGFEDTSKDISVTKEMSYKKYHTISSLDEIMMVSKPVEKKKETGTCVADDGIPCYTIQILSLKWPVKSFDVFSPLEQEQIKEYKCKDGFYRYSYGIFKGYKKSLKGKEKVLKTGKWQDAFIRDVKQYEDLIEKKE